MAQRGSGGTDTENRRQGGRGRWSFGGRTASRSGERRLRTQEAIGFGAPLTAAFIALTYLGGRKASAEEGEPPAGGEPAIPPEVAAEAAAGRQMDGTTVFQGAAAVAPLVAPATVSGIADLLEPRPVDPPAGLRLAEVSPPATGDPSGGPDGTPSDPPPPSPVAAAASGPPPTAPAAVLPGAGDAPDGSPVGDENLGRVATATAGDAELAGTAGDDLLRGGEGADLLTGFGGDDRLEGGAGDDILDGGEGRDRLTGGPGADRLEGGAGDDLLEGDGGDDFLQGGPGRDVLSGGPGDDILDGGPGFDRLAGGPGDDILVIDHPADTASDEAGPAGGSDILRVEAGYAENLAALRPGTVPDGAATFVLGPTVGRGLPEGANGYLQEVGAGIEHVELRGDADHDLLGDGGDNRLLGNAGDNAVWGGDGDDLLAGGPGDDLLDGGPGDDLLDGGEGADMLYGGAGDDTFLLGLAEDGPDRIFDHRGANGLRFEGPADTRLTARLEGADLEILADGQNIATILGYADDPRAWTDIAIGGETRPVASLLGGDGSGEADLLRPFATVARTEGSDGDDILAGGEGRDWLSGGAGNDLLRGGAGDDLLEGGSGNDLLRGGEGDDLYLLRAGEGGIDRIEDAAGTNRIAMPDAGVGELGGFLAGEDLWITVDGAPAAVVDGFAADPQAFAGVRTGDGFVSAGELVDRNAG